MKKRLMTLAACAALAMAGVASASTFDAAKNAPFAANAQTSQQQVDAKKAPGYATNVHYTAQAPANSVQVLTAQPNYGGAIMNKAKWIDVGQAKKVLTAEAKKPTVIALAAKKATPFPSIDVAEAQGLVLQTAAKSTTLQQRNGMFLAGAKDDARGYKATAAGYVAYS